MTTGSGGLQQHGNVDIFVSNQKGQLMGTIITRSDKEVLHFFDEMKRVEKGIGPHRPFADGKPVPIGRGKLPDRYGTGRKAQAEQAYAAGLQKQRHIALLPDRRKNPIPGKRYRTTAGKEPERSVLTSSSVYGKGYTNTSVGV